MKTRGSTTGRRVWIDIDNPPQVQYLTPIAEAFARGGDTVIVTARDHGIAHELLRERGLDFIAVGSHAGASKLAKSAAILRRTSALLRQLRPWKPDGAVFATRSAALAAPLLRIPGFALVDYEFVDLRAFRFARSYVVHPSLLEQPLKDRGVHAPRLLGYEGIKEDITFSGIDVDEVEPYPFPELASSARRILVRPPDDRSHYYTPASSRLTRAALEQLAALRDVVVILTPRYPEQVRCLDGLSWSRPPLVLHEAVPFLRLLKAVDAVLTGGGTMAREAAYLGVPSYSVYAGRPGAVDTFLERIGRLVTIRDESMLGRLDVGSRHRAPMLASNPQAANEIASAIGGIVDARR